MEMKSAANLEMETLVRSWHEGGYTDDEFCEQLDMLVSRHTAKVTVTKHFANGLKRYAITDKNGLLIAEYTGK